jgi:quercetin dioxygenase-like cupin family protein
VTALVIRADSLEGGGDAALFNGSEHGAPVSFFLLHSRPGAGPGLHRHPYVETFVVEEGEATFTVGDQTVVVHGGEIVVAPADVPHSFVNSGAGVLRSVNIHPVPVMQTEWLE